MEKSPDSTPSTSSFETNDDKPEKTSKKARKIGAAARHTLEHVDKPDVAEKPPLDLEKLFSSKPPEEKAETSIFTEKPPADDTTEKAKTEANEPAIESDPELTELKHVILKEHLAENHDALTAEREAALPHSPERAAIDAELALNEAVDSRIDDPEQEFDPAVEAAYQEQLAEITDEELAERQEPATVLEIVHEEPLETDELVEDPEADDPALPPTTPATPPAHSIPPLPPMGGNTQPAAPPPPPHWNTPVTVMRGDDTPVETPPPVPTSSPNVLRTPSAQDSERSSKAGAFLLGGILGYMIGRRGGRKRTEARLEPEINKLTDEVKASQEHLEAREIDLKQLVINHEQERKADQKAAAEREQTHKTELKAEKAKDEKKLQQVSEVLSKAVVPEVAEAPAEVSAPETLKPETKPIPPSQSKEAELKHVLRRTEQLSTPELLKTAETLYINGTSVRELYNTNQIDRHGLVHIVQESLRGNSLTNAFEKVELGRERQRERAREFRHDPAAGTPTDPASSSATAPTQGILPDSLQLPNTPDTRSLQPLGSSPANQPQHSNTEGTQTDRLPDQRSQTAKIAGFTVLAILLALFLVWFLFQL